MTKKSALSDYQFRYQPEFLQNSWSMPVRVAAIGFGLAILRQGFRNRGVTRGLLLGTSFALLARALSNVSIIRLLGLVVNPVVKLHKTIEVFAPVEDVYAFLKNFKFYSQFMSYVHEVDINDRGGLRWTAVGPAGFRVHWHAAIAKMAPNQIVAWKSLPGSLITNQGIIRMREFSSGLTHVDVELTFAPPAGALGYAVAHLLGFDPSTRFDEDLEVMKKLIESRSYEMGASG